MKIVLQRVARASVAVEKEKISEIGQGYLLLVGIAPDDTDELVTKAAEKISKIRLFPSDSKDINASIIDIKGEILAVSQFTLLADTSTGNRPSFIRAANPEMAEPLFKSFVRRLNELGIQTQTGKFGHYMDVSLANDGPVTIVLDY